MKRRLVAGALALALLASCGGDDDDKVSARKDTTTTRRDATTTSSNADGGTTSSSGAGVTSTTRRASTATTRGTAGTNPTGTTGTPGVVDGVKVTRVATLTQPIALAVRPGEPGAVYVAQKGGTVRRLLGTSVTAGNVLDITSRISTGSEQGLLGIAFSPDGNWLYASYTNTDGDSRIVVYPFSAGRANASLEREILAVDQPYPNHNGGQINFGPDGHLYIAFGDGGSGGDPQNRAQNLSVLLGKILRIAPRTSGSPAYTIPPGNPFVGTTAARPEIWHYGLRNPWRWSFDRANGEQWIADVGQNEYEEVNHVGAGAKGVNFGWRLREGKHSYNGGAQPPGGVDPEFETTHSAGNCSITGGYVYRGTAIRGFAGTYVFADFCRGELMAYSGGSLRQLGIKVQSPSSFGEDAHGELYVLSLSGPVYKLERN